MSVLPDVTRLPKVFLFRNAVHSGEAWHIGWRSGTYELMALGCGVSLTVPYDIHLGSDKPPRGRVCARCKRTLEAFRRMMKAA